MADVESVKKSVARSVAVVVGDKTEYAFSDDNYFNSDHALGATPSLTIDLTSNMGSIDIERFELTNVRYYLDVDGGVHTFRLYLFEAASADDIQNISDVVFDSGASQAEAKAYEWDEGGMGEQGAATTVEHQLPKIVTLSVKNKLYYCIDWSAPPASSVRGYIKIRGKLLK